MGVLLLDIWQPVICFDCRFHCGSDSNGLILGTWPQAVVDAHHPTI